MYLLHRTGCKENRTKSKGLVPKSLRNVIALRNLLCVACFFVCVIACLDFDPIPQAPFLGDFDENFTFQELRKMEHEVLDKLNWKLGYSTPHDYIHFWVGRAEWGVDRKKTIMLCNEAIGMCTVEADFANPRSAGIFGAGAMLWAYHAQGLPTAKLENEFTSIMGVEEVCITHAKCMRFCTTGCKCVCDDVFRTSPAHYSGPVL